MKELLIHLNLKKETLEGKWNNLKENDNRKFADSTYSSYYCAMNY